MIFFPCKKYWVVSVFLIFFDITSAQAQSLPVNGIVEPDFEHITRFMADYMGATGTTAATLELRKKDGQVLLRQGYGWLNPGKTEETRPDTMLRIASITKSFTHLAINQLVDAGVISMSARAFCLNGEAPSGTGCLLSVTPTGNDGIPDSGAEDITLQHLLEHKAGWDESTADVNGVYDPLGGSVMIANILSVQSPPTYQQMLDYQLDQALDYTPGTDNRYSNFGYVILGHVIEQYSGLNFIEYIYENITDDLDIARSEIELGSELVHGRNSREPQYVSTDSSNVQNLFDPTAQYVQRPDGGVLIERAAGAGGIVTTTSALLDYMHGYWLFDPSPRNFEEGWEWIHGGAGDGTLAYATQNSPLPGMETQADWVVMLNKWPASEVANGTLHSQLRTLIRNTLTKDVAIEDNEGDARSEQLFTLYIPGNTASVKFTSQSGTGDIDLYVKSGEKPTTTNYDCRSINYGTGQVCDITAPANGTYYAMLLGNTQYSGVSITGAYTESANGIDCSVDYDIVNDWDNGFQVAITITNNGDSDINGYELEWTPGAGESFNSGWNATFNTLGSTVTASNPSSAWNGVIAASGGTVSFGFLALNSSSPADVINSFTLNSTNCN